MAVEVLELALQVIESGNRNAISDGGSAAALAEAALEGAGLNVRINIASLEDNPRLPIWSTKSNILIIWRLIAGPHSCYTRWTGGYPRYEAVYTSPVASQRLYPFYPYSEFVNSSVHRWLSRYPAICSWNSSHDNPDAISTPVIGTNDFSPFNHNPTATSPQETGITAIPTTPALIPPRVHIQSGLIQVYRSPSGRVFPCLADSPG